MAPLTGSAAVDALKLYTRLGAANARFDATKVARAVRTRAGRLRLAVGIFTALRRPQAPDKPQARPRTRTAAKRTTASPAKRSKPRIAGEG